MEGLDRKRERREGRTIECFGAVERDERDAGSGR
jgi:hypothetical protein